MGTLGTTELSGTTLSNPNYEQEGYVQAGVDVGVQHQMADGSITYDSVTTRLRFSLEWNAITEVQRDAIWTKYQVKTSQTFSPPDSATDYTVFVVPNTWHCSYLEAAGGTRYYYCGLALEEAS